jgi:acyl-CoA thioester hydrolase
VGEHQGARFERFVKLTSSSSGKILVESKTVWCMLDAKTGRPVRIGEDVLGVL